MQAMLVVADPEDSDQTQEIQHMIWLNMAFHAQKRLSDKSQKQALFHPHHKGVQESMQ